MVAKVKREKVVAVVPQVVQVGVIAPAIAQEFMAEDQKPRAVVAAPVKIAAGEPRPSWARNVTGSPRSEGVTRSGMKSGRSSKIRLMNRPVADHEINQEDRQRADSDAMRLRTKKSSKLNTPVTGGLLIAWPTFASAPRSLIAAVGGQR